RTAVLVLALFVAGRLCIAQTTSPTISPLAAELAVERGEPDASSLQKAIGAISGRDQMAREAAIRRLAPYPKAAAPAVVALFAKGDLATRLASLELLESWHAPIAGLDPWIVQTITSERMDLLRAWAKSPTETPP